MKEIKLNLIENKEKNILLAAFLTQFQQKKYIIEFEYL